MPEHTPMLQIPLRWERTYCVDWVGVGAGSKTAPQEGGGCGVEHMAYTCGTPHSSTGCGGVSVDIWLFFTPLLAQTWGKLHKKATFLFILKIAFFSLCTSYVVKRDARGTAVKYVCILFYYTHISHNYSHKYTTAKMPMHQLFTIWYSYLYIYVLKITLNYLLQIHM